MENIKNKKTNVLLRLLIIIVLICAGYIIFSYVKSLFKNHVNTYQVERGSLKKAESFKGFIYRDEQLISAPKSGYCAYIYNNNQRVAKDSLIMIFTDKDYSESNSDEIDKNLIYDRIKKYNFDENDFYTVYSYHNNMDNYISDLNNTIATYIDSKAYGDKNGVNVYAKNSGILSYCIDGLENEKISEYNSKVLLNKDYYDNTYKGYYNAGEVVAKIITNPVYKIVFDSDSELLKNYIGKTINIEIENNNRKIDGILDTYDTNDSKSHYMLTVDKYLEEYDNYRVIDFNIVYKESFGMKIPNACIFSRNCFAIEKEFIENNELDKNYYIYKLDEKNNKKQYQVDISYVDDKYYYILYDENNNILNINDKITYHDKVLNVSSVKAFEGVFCINKGYKVFKIIKVLDKNTEYSIISRDYHSSLKEYDILLLNVDF